MDKIKAFGNDSDAIAIQGDISDLSTPDKLVEETLKAFNTSHIHILVNCAGHGGFSRKLTEITPEEFDAVYYTNVRGTMFLTKAVVSHMPRGGRIINFSSVAARGGYANHTVYGSSKVAVEALTRTWATELGPKGITVNAVNPGPVETDLFRAAGDEIISYMENAAKKTPGGRIADVNDIAQIVAFLASEGSRWVTGDVVSSNGGMMYL